MHSRWRALTLPDSRAVFLNWIENRICHLFEDPLFFDHSDARERLESHLPLFKWHFEEGAVSVLLIAPYRAHLEKFFFELLHRWVMPGKKIETPFSFSMDVEIFKGKVYTFAEVLLRLDPTDDLQQIEWNLKVIETEIRLGMISVYHASKILDFRSGGEKGAQIQEKITKLIQRKPDEIDYDIFGEMQHFLVLSKEEFKTARSAHHLSRLIVLFYSFRKSIQKAIEVNTEKRQVRSKAALSLIDLPWGMKQVLAVVVGVGMIHPGELFEEKHLIRAVQNIYPQAQAIHEAFFFHESMEDGICLLYLEFEKEDGSLFTAGEVKHIQKELPQQVGRTVERVARSLFLPRNEEEVVRGILSLASQLRFVRDLPQVTLSFSDQIGSILSFQVILVRILLPQMIPIAQMFESQNEGMTFLLDRIKLVGMVRKKYPKEATVFELRLPGEEFLRDDSTIDVLRARQEVIRRLQVVIGEVRDYNGGMIAKQIELLQEIKQKITFKDRLQEMQLEALFHTLYPVEMRSILAAESVVFLFSVWQSLLSCPEHKLEVLEREEGVYIMSKERLNLDPKQEVITVCPKLFGESFFGYIVFSTDPASKARFVALTRRG